MAVLYDEGGSAPPPNQFAQFLAQQGVDVNAWLNANDNQRQEIIDDYVHKNAGVVDDALSWLVAGSVAYSMGQGGTIAGKYSQQQIDDARRDIVSQFTQIGGPGISKPPPGAAPPTPPSRPTPTTKSSPGGLRLPGGLGGYGGTGFKIPSPSVQKGDLEQFLRGQGFNFRFDVSPFIDKAIKNGGGNTSTQFSIFMSSLMHSPQFNTYYPGIRRPDGTLRMNLAEYDQYMNTVQAQAKQAGLSLTLGEVGQMVGGDVSLKEAGSRVQMAQTLNANPGMLQQFNAALQAQGLGGITSAQGALDFMEGKSQKQVYDTWNASALAAGAASAGLPSSAQHALELASRQTDALSPDEVEKMYGDVAAKLKTFGPELGGMGISQNDLETIEFGGAGREKLAATAQQAIANREAQLQVGARGEYAVTAATEGLQIGRSGRPTGGPVTPTGA